MKVFGTESTAVGCFVRFNLQLNAAGAAMLIMPKDGGTGPVFGGQESSHLPFVIVDVQTEAKENLSVQKCFGSRFYTYAFGADIENVNVTLAAFLTGGKDAPALWSKNRKANSNPAGSVSSGAFTIMREAYEDGRISNSQALGTLSMAGGSIDNLMLVGSNGSVQNLGGNIYQFQLRFVALPAPFTKEGDSAP